MMVLFLARPSDGASDRRRIMLGSETSRKSGRPMIFISYARADFHTADAVVRALEQHELSVFLDRDLQAGSSWAETLKSGIEQADKVVVLMSPDYFESRWCQAELAEAFRLEKPIIPVMSRPCEPSGPLQYLSSIDLTTATELDLARLASALSEAT